MAEDTSDEDGWDYEYSATETETFYVDLDLSSVNGVIKSQNAGERKSLKRPAQVAEEDVGANNKRQKATDEADDAQDEYDDAGNEDVGNEDTENVGVQGLNSPRPPGLLDDEDSANRLQILDLDTTNPIISYNGDLYGCTWHDMLGTTLFVTKHQEAPFHEPEISTEEYDLIGTSRIKLVGHRAKVIPRAGSRKQTQEDDEDGDMRDGKQQTEPAAAIAERMRTRPTLQGLPQTIRDGRSLGTITRTNPKVNIEIKQQANFLEQLMETKKARGETDTVRTFVDRHTVAADARQARKAARTAKDKENEKQKEKEETTEQRLRREIDELNKRVVKGDNDALERLQEIYADMEEVEDDEDDLLIEGAAAGVMAGANAPNTGNC